jgi:hypothetical protein
MLLTLLLIAPITLAHASPPDQTWLAGVYDQAAFDEVVCLLTSALQVIESTAASEDGPVLPSRRSRAWPPQWQARLALASIPCRHSELRRSPDRSDPPLGDQLSVLTIRLDRALGKASELLVRRRFRQVGSA